MSAIVIKKPQPVSQASQHSQPEPLRRPLPPAKAFPIDVLGSTLAGAVSAIHDTVRSPLAMAGSSVLAAACLAAQTHADVLIDGRKFPISQFFLTIGGSGERKTGTDAPALRAHRETERQRFERYAMELPEYRAELAVHQSSLSTAGRIKDEQERRRAILNAGPAPVEPLLANLICSEPTLEGLHKLLMGGRGNLGLFSDEGGQFFGGHAMAKEHVAKTAAGLSSLWDSGVFDRVRAGDGASKVFGKRLAMHLLLQPVIAERVLSDSVLSGQGFLARCLVAWPESTAGTRMYVERDLSTDHDMGRYWRTMTELLNKPLPLKDGSRNEIAPRALVLAPGAKRLWIAAHDEIEKLNSRDGEYAQIRSHSSKAAEQAARIAGVLTVVDDPEAGTISADTIQRALELVDFYLSEALRLAGTAEISPEVKRAEALLAWCHERSKILVHSAELVRLGPNCIRERRHLAQAMDELERAGWAASVDGGMEIDGSHRRSVWRIQSEG